MSIIIDFDLIFAVISSHSAYEAISKDEHEIASETIVYFLDFNGYNIVCFL